MLVEFLLEEGGRLFGKKAGLLTLWQEIAENFYPERADFTVVRSLGTEFASGLTTGYPILARRELANIIGGMLRPASKVWAHARVDGWDEVGVEGRAWLERAGDRQRRAMYHRGTQFQRATKEADNDFITFGQAVIQVSKNRNANGLLYRCWHLRDVAWNENDEGTIDVVFRKWHPTAIGLVRLFPKTVSEKIREKAKSKPYDTVEVWHCVIPSDVYEQHSTDKQSRLPWRSIYVDTQSKSILEDVPLRINEYMIPRWQTVSGSQYAYSPATVVGLPDARTLQEMTLTLLEAGEKAVTPPLLGVQEALRSDVNVMAGGITWVDREYDERLGEVLRPLTIDKSGIPLGMEMSDRIELRMRDAFYLNVLKLPSTGSNPQMTAYEVGQRIQEDIRQTLPLFEPMEPEYNYPLCEKSFDILLNAGVFGPITGIPDELQGRNIEFFFESPLHDAVERAKAQKYLEATSLVANAAAADPEVIHLLDAPKGARDALLSSGVPANWVRTEKDVETRVKAAQQAAQTAQTLEQMKLGSEVAKNIGLTPTPSGTGNTGAPLI